MTNEEIAKTFAKLAFFLSLKEENKFRVNAYLKASRSILKCPLPVEEILAAGEDLTQIEGIGKIIAKKIEDLIIFGEITTLSELLREYPESLFEISQIKGIGPKTILKIHHYHQVASLMDLRKLLDSGQPLKIPASYANRIREHFRR